MIEGDRWHFDSASQTWIRQDGAARVVCELADSYIKEAEADERSWVEDVWKDASVGGPEKVSDQWRPGPLKTHSLFTKLLHPFSTQGEKNFFLVGLILGVTICCVTRWLGWAP